MTNGKVEFATLADQIAFDVQWIKAALADTCRDSPSIAVGIGTLTVLMFMRMHGVSKYKQVTNATLNFTALNTACTMKEVMLAYLSAAILEPALAIMGAEHAEGRQIVVNLANLLGICWWIFLLVDSFDYTDTARQKTYAGFVEDAKEDKKKYGFLKVRDAPKTTKIEHSIHLDIALWFQFACIGAAFTGFVTHRDVMHAWLIVILWAILHHSCKKATSWGTGYWVSFVLPSAALLPLEWCLPMRDCFDGVGSVDDVKEYVDFIKLRCGIDLSIEA